MAAKTDKLTDIGLLVLRIGLGAVLLYYGTRKVFPVFGSHGFQEQLAVWEMSRGIPKWLGVLAIVSEFAGSIGMIFGLLARLAGFGIACTMGTAFYFNAVKPGAWDQILSGNGQVAASVFFPLTLMVLALGLTLTGPGAFSLDRRLFKKGKK